MQSDRESLGSGEGLAGGSRGGGDTQGKFGSGRITFIRSHVVHFTLCGVGFASVGFSPVCLVLSPSPVSLLFRTPFASFSFCRLAYCLAVFRMYFVFWLVCVSLSLGSLSCSLAFVFRFHIPFYLGLFI